MRILKSTRTFLKKIKLESFAKETKEYSYRVMKKLKKLEKKVTLRALKSANDKSMSRKRRMKLLNVFSITYRKKSLKSFRSFVMKKLRYRD
jgi:hypothetical protein